ncbi:MAG TPA: hypothetical protein VGL72_28220 [Bryobacteraceae bacterium]
MHCIKVPEALRLPLIVLAGYLAIGSQSGYAQASLPSGTIGAQVVGRILIQADLTVKLYGYFTYMQGVPGPLFSGTPGENTAMLTFSADPTAATLISNGDIIQALENPVNGQFTNLTVYYNANPSARSLANPDDFTQGQSVALFQSRAGAVNISASGTFQATGALNTQTGSFFFINNQPVNIYNLVSGLTLNLFGPAPSLSTITAGLAANGNFSIPLAGTAYVALPQN